MLFKLITYSSRIFSKTNLITLAIGQIILLGSLEAQKLDMEKLTGLKPRAIGPAGMSGRITAIDAVIKNPDIIYAGAASGGLWRSEDRGITWKPIFENEKTSSVGAVAVHQNNPDVLWVGTGEGNPRNSHTGGYGVYKSLDGGKTWKLMGLENTRCIHRIIINQNNPDIVYVGAIGSPWGAHPERGVFKTTDGGKTWKKVLYINDMTGVADMVVDPENPNKLLVAMWEHRRYPWFFNSGGTGSGIYITHDGGENWEKRTTKDGLPEGNLGRVGLAIARSNPEIIYAIIESKKNAIYKSEDGGLRWTKVTETGEFGNRPFYYSEIYVDPKNENRLYSLWSYVSMSDDGGKTWKVIADYGNNVHPDHHAWWIDPNNPDFLIDGNDGGLYLSENRGKTWRFAENLPVGQFYHVNVDMQQPYNIYGGMQDNGSWQGPAYVWREGGLRNAYWNEILFGDGFDVVPDPNEPEYAYAMWQAGNLARINLTTGETKLLQPVHSQGVKLRFNWNAALAHDPLEGNTIYYGSQFLHKSSDNGNTWAIISPDLTTNDTTKQKQQESGGLSFDITGAENFTTIVSIAPSPVKQEIIWVGTDDGNLQLTRDGGKTWSNVVGNIKGVPTGTWIPQIRASTYKPEEAFVVFDNHRRDDWGLYVYYTQYYGKSWTRLASTDQVEGYALSIIQDPLEPNLLFLGTEFGLYVSIDKGKNWTKWTQGYPTVSTMDLAIHPREHDLIIGTFGRAIYVLDDIRPLRALAKDYKTVTQKSVHVFEVPEAILAVYRQAPGLRFGAQSTYQGENRKAGAMLTFWLDKVKMKPNEDKKQASLVTGKNTPLTTDKPADALASQDTLKIMVEVMDERRNVIRTLKITPKPGINRTFWDLTRKGVPFPGSKRSQTKDAPEPSGPQVLPGTYTVRFTYENAKDSIQIKVLPDPRHPVPLEDIQAKNKLVQRIYASIEVTNQALERLKEAQETTELIAKKLKPEQSDPTKKDEKLKLLQEQAQRIQDSIKVLNGIILQKQDIQGYYSNPDLLSSQLSRSYEYLQATWDAPTEAQKLLVEQTEKSLLAVVGRVNKFFENDWASFQKAVVDHQFSLFKPYKPLEIKQEN